MSRGVFVLRRRGTHCEERRSLRPIGLSVRAAHSGLLRAVSMSRTVSEVDLQAPSDFPSASSLRPAWRDQGGAGADRRRPPSSRLAGLHRLAGSASFDEAGIAVVDAGSARLSRGNLGKAGLYQGDVFPEGWLAFASTAVRTSLASWKCGVSAVGVTVGCRVVRQSGKREQTSNGRPAPDKDRPAA